MKIELLKQRFMHLGLLTCLIVGATSTMSHANMHTVITNAITALENAQRKDLADIARASKERLTDLLHTAKRNLECMVDKQAYTHTVHAIAGEFENFKQAVVVPMGSIEACAHEHRQLMQAIATLQKVIDILKGIANLAPATRALVAKRQLDPHRNEFITA